MEALEKELRGESLLKEFKDTFEIESRDRLECGECGYEAERVEREYSHTIPHREPFEVEHGEMLTDYKCPKCSRLTVTKYTRLNLNSKILIVHINRFSVQGGTTKKELPTQPIKRRLQGYELVGMVFHIGKGIEHGHYTYYSRVDRQRWVEMNDGEVTEFVLEREEEAFELEMKAEKTPYLLFYKRGLP